MTDEDRKQIIQLRKQGLGYKAIARALDLTRDSVRGFCKRNNLDGHADIVKLNIQVMKEKEILCLNCGKPFKTKKQGRPRKYCSDFCRRSWWNKNKDEIKKIMRLFINTPVITARRSLACTEIRKENIAVTTVI